MGTNDPKKHALGPEQPPSVGRMVHYMSFGTPGGEYKSEERSAIITVVHDADEGHVGLAILNPTGIFFNTSVNYCPSGTPGTWRYPAFVPKKS